MSTDEQRALVGVFTALFPPNQPSTSSRSIDYTELPALVREVVSERDQLERQYVTLLRRFLPDEYESWQRMKLEEAGIEPSSSASEVETESGAASGADPCCGNSIYWCPQVVEFECPTHGGFSTCCERPERHTPLARFEVQANAIMKWWRENREQPDEDDEEGVLSGPEVDPGQVLAVGETAGERGADEGPRAGADASPAPGEVGPRVGDAGRQGGWELVAYWRPRAQAPDPRQVRAGRFADLPRKVAHREQQVGQQYRSNACIHERHDECDGECVYCHDGCACACHPWNEKVDADEFRRRYMNDETRTGGADDG